LFLEFQRGLWILIRIFGPSQECWQSITNLWYQLFFVLDLHIKRRQREVQQWHLN
jgi:hypothetical protein